MLLFLVALRLFVVQSGGVCYCPVAAWQRDKQQHTAAHHQFTTKKHLGSGEAHALSPARISLCYQRTGASANPAHRIPPTESRLPSGATPKGKQTTIKHRDNTKARSQVSIERLISLRLHVPSQRAGHVPGQVIRLESECIHSSSLAALTHFTVRHCQPTTSTPHVNLNYTPAEVNKSRHSRCSAGYEERLILKEGGLRTQARRINPQPSCLLSLRSKVRTLPPWLAEHT